MSATDFILRLDGDALERRLLVRSRDDIDTRRRLHRFVADRAPLLSPPAATVCAVTPPRIFIYWAQGFDNAPEIVKCCHRQLLATQSPHRVTALDDGTIGDVVVLPSYVYDSLGGNKTHFSDLLRVSLLAEYGGFWSDATCLHMCDLAQWYPAIVLSGFFAYTQTNTFMLSSWFIAASAGAIIPTLMRDILFAYWREHSDLEHYFLFHFLFEALYNQCEAFREQWDRTPRISATDPHLLQEELRNAYDPMELRRLLARAAVHKLTYKLNDISPDSMFQFLCDNRHTLRS